MPSTPETYAGGLIAGQYHAPNFEFIFAENIIQGGPVVSANFQDFVFLFCGSGPLTTPTAGATGPRVGQLDPAPWATPMPEPMFAGTLCPDEKRVDGTGGIRVAQAPIAVAVATPMSVASGQTVSLSALISSDPNTPPQPLSYRWTQTGGPVVALAGPSTATPSFKAPSVAVPTTLSFRVAVQNSVPLISYAEVTVTVSPPSALPTLTFYAPATALPGSVVTMIGTISSGTTFTWTQTAGPLVALSGSDTLTPSFTAPVGPADLKFVLTATTAAGASISLERTVSIAADFVAITNAVWDNRQGKGKFNVVATSNTIATAVPPAGYSMNISMWNRNIAAGLPGSATNPLIAPMTLVSNVVGQLPDCPTALPCFVAPLDSVIVDPASSSLLPVFVPPTSIMVKTSYGGSATATGIAITIR
jgi:hypothetical protein